MNDLDILSSNIENGFATIRDISQVCASVGFDDLNQVVAAQQALHDIKAMAHANYVYALDLLDSANEVTAALQDPRALFPNIITACNNLKSEADLAYIILAKQYGIDIFDNNDSSDNYVAASENYSQYDGLEDYNNILANQTMGSRGGLNFNFLGSK